MRKRIIKLKPGFTLIELLVTAAISSFLLLVLSTMFANGLKSYRLGGRQIDANERAVRAISDFEKTIRSTTEVENVSDSYLILYAYLRSESAAAYPSKVEYEYDSADKKFYRKVSEPQVGSLGELTGYGAPEENELASFVESAVFTYYNAGNASLSDPIQTDVVKMINLELKVDIDPDNPPDPATQGTSVQLRNLKTNL